MKKGFTLIEILAVVIVLAIIALISTPIILDVVEDTRKSANLSSANMVLSSAKNYYAESILDTSKKDKMDGKTNLFYDLQIENKPKEGTVYINEEGNVALVLILDNTCYVKSYNTGIEEYPSEAEECDLASAIDETKPTVTLELIGGEIGNNEWYTTSPFVKVLVTDDVSGFGSYKWCQGIDCTPNNIELTNESSKELSDGENSSICVIGIDKAGNESDKTCSTEVKVDTTKPEFSGIGDIVVQVNEKVDLITGVEVIDVTSGIDGTFTTDPTSVDTTKTGTKEVVYIVVDNAGNKTEVTRKVIVSANAPTITYSVAEGAINENGWANKDFYVTINVTDNTGKGLKEFKVCTSSIDTCDPTNGSVITDSTTATREIVVESNNNRICVQATDNDNQTSEIICSNAYKLDKTAPVAGTINITGTKGENDWYTSDVTIEVVDGSDTLSGHLNTTANPTSITENTEGTKIIVTTTDKAGNTSSNEYTIKVDKTIPTVTINRTTSDNKNVLIATINPSENVSGYTYQWYKNGNIISNVTNISYTTNEAGTYKLEVTTGTGKVVSSNEITINSYTITYNLNGGTGSIASTIKIEDINTNITKAIPTRSGYTFVGWGITATDKETTYASDATYELNENKTLYAIWKKGYTLTFVANGATLSSTSVGCEVYNAEESCSVTTPTITRSNYTIIGYNTNKDATTSQIGSNSKISVSSDATYYAITSRELVANFNKNTVYSISATSSKCTIYNEQTSCTPTLPTITAQTNFVSQNWGTSASQTSAGVTSITLSTSNTGNTWYALNSRELNWNFNKNVVSAIGSTSAKCTIWSTSGSCNITTLTITPTSGYTQNGWGTATNSTSATVAVNTTKTLNNSTTGGTYYALQYKTVSATFVANNATLVDTSNTDSNTKDSCTMYNAETSCTVYSPNITAPSNTPTVLGFNTTSNATSSVWNVNTAKSISSDVTYYAITRKDAKTYTITYTKGTGVSAIGATSGSCNIGATYNGTAQATTCSVTLPTITAATGYTVAGWYNSSGTKLGNASASISVSATQTITAKATINSYTCQAGYYLSGNATSCTKCEAGSYCSGGTYTYSSSTQGKSTCPSGYGTSVAGSDAASDCYKTITVTYAGNGATSGSTSSSSCNAYYNNGSCSITLRANGFTKTNYTFQGWSTDTSSVTHNANTAYSFSSNATLNAIWKSAYICKRATTLHEEKCYSSTCSNNYYFGATITYGSLGTSGTLASGDAFDCDVNGDGVYDSATERFYYVSDLSSNSDYVVLIYYNNTTNGVADNTSLSAIAYDSSGYSYQGPRTAITNLPTTTQWNKVKLSNTSRKLLTDTGTTTSGNPSSGGYSLPASFSYAGYAARLLTTQEISSASCSSLFKDCNYLMENTAEFSGDSSAEISGYWLENPYNYQYSSASLVHGQMDGIAFTGANASGIGTRPVIEVLKTDISY